MRAYRPTLQMAPKNILFATDFSLSADLAAPFAIQMAKRYGAKVYGVHVNRLQDYAWVSPAAWAPMAESLERESREQTQRLNEQLAEVAHEVEICDGNVCETILKRIQEKDIDLVVVGTHGRTGLGKVLLGSVAEQILRQAPCPVLSVGPLSTLRPDRTTRMQEILYATDLTLDSPPALVFAVALAQENRSRLTLLHVMEEQVNAAFGHPSEFAKARLDKLRRLVPPAAELFNQPQYVIECLVEQGTPAEQILRTAEAHNADLIVLEARPEKGLTTHLDLGTVHKVVAHASCPVLTVMTERRESESTSEALAYYALA